MEEIVKYLGNFHPVVLHLPIGAFLFTLLLFAYQKFTKIKLTIPIRLGLIFSFISAIVSSILGFILQFYDEYEVIEAEIIETSELINKELKNSDLPDQIRIGAVLRDNKVIIPRSNFIFQKDDIVVFLAKRDHLSIVENMFRISSI